MNRRKVVWSCRCGRTTATGWPENYGVPVRWVFCGVCGANITRSEWAMQRGLDKEVEKSGDKSNVARSSDTIENDSATRQIILTTGGDSNREDVRDGGDEGRGDGQV